jgi:hypothetical protein
LQDAGEAGEVMLRMFALAIFRVGETMAHSSRS